MEEVHNISLYKELFIPGFNVSILVGLLYYKLKDPVKNFVRNRQVSLSEELETSQRKLREAQIQYEEFSARLKAIGVEIESLKRQAATDAESIKIKTIQQAKQMSESLIADVKATSAGRLLEMKSQILAEFSQLVLDRSEKVLKERLTGDDKARIRREFSSLVENMR